MGKRSSTTIVTYLHTLHDLIRSDLLNARPDRTDDKAKDPTVFGESSEVQRVNEWVSKISEQSTERNNQTCDALSVSCTSDSPGGSLS